MAYREHERTLSAPDDWTVPDLEVDGTTVERAGTVRLDALYYDTPDLRLLARGITLRRRTGGDDAGWHLKLPAPGDARDEERRPLGDDGDALPDQLPEPHAAPQPPDDLVRLVAGLARRAPLVPVARLRTQRRVVVLRDARGAALVEVAEDRVATERLVAAASEEDADAAPGTNAEPHRGRRTDAWREIEVEILPAGHETDDPQALLDAVVDALVDSGAHAEPSGPKLSRALGDAVPAPRATSTSDRDRDGSAGAVVVRYLREQVDALLDRDPDVRRDAPDAVHKARVAARRLRSALATFRPLLDREVAEPVREELRWWGRVLGEARDAEVARDRIRVVLDRLPDELVVGPVRARVVDELDGRYREALRTAVAQMGEDRYFDLLTALEDLADDLPLTDRAAGAAPDVLPALARTAWKRTRRRARGAAAVEGERRDELLHDVRKAAKRARYAGESMEPAVGKDAARFAERLEAVQDALGEHHDAVALARSLRELGMRANLSGENGFSYGLLVGIERERADRALADFDDAWERARRKRYRRWTAR
ncbi:CYTH and CHAD domain-containing protein [Cellulosimicrobium sp. Marseille-Q4280]|uniref:CYTH and CHAD domain-containing protein n=1 Tax=Cellulosimicrobium sp. Marseille-Q4280 TaxID=2937992 RepID=UPI0020416692|nr:CYTH and CHAD domain-containing protein [Cellulosimicrobium sp. Marseille-Q4280]